ncbi:hypothetical protein BJ742DRAFT_459041 [Cladochytrium replicatum]|nr:hypothetical protein BJ742DRAFT_459041 [Cladochytrium replicatum]
MRNPSAPPSPTPNNVDNAIDDGSDAGYSNVSHDDPEDGSSKIRNPFLKLATIFEKPKTGFRKNSIDRGIGNMFEEPAGFDPSGPPDSAESSQSSMRADSAKKLEQFFGEEFNKGSSKNASQGPRSTRRKKTRGESKMKTTTSKRQSAKRRKSGKYIDMNDLLLYDEILEEDEQESDFSAHADKVELERPASEMIVDNLDAYFPDLKNGLELVIGEDVADSLVDEQKKPEAVDDLSKWDTERKALGSIRVETIKLNLRESLKARRNSRLDRRTNRVDRVAHRYQFEDLEEEHEHNLEVESTHDARDDESIHVIRPDSIRKDRLSNFDSSSTISVDTDQKSIRSVTEVWRDRIASISSEALFITEDASQVGTDPLRRTSTVGLGVGLWAAAAEGAERKRFRESEGTGLAGTGLLVRTSTGPRRRSDGTQPWTKLKEEVLRKPFLGDAVSDTLKRKNAVLQKRPDDVSLQAPDSGQKDAEKSSLVPPEVVIDKIVDSESESESEEETPIVQDDENVGVKGGTHGFAFVDGIEQEVDVGGLSPAAEAVASVGAAPLQVKWVRGKLIGKGSFGRVYHGINLTNNMIMAVKQVEVAVPRKWKAPGIAGPFEPLDKMRQKMVDALTQEISLLKELNHENIVRYEGFAVEGNTISVFLEYVSGGSVATLLGSIGPFEEGMISSLVFQILSGLKYLHERCIIHRDIKGANILVDEQGLAKISDFGISKKNEHKMAYRYNSRMSLQGSVYWMAPEVVQQRGYSAKVDIWSLGCVVVEMFSGAHPWKQLDETQTMWQLGARHSPSLSEGVKASAEAREFLEQCFTIDPDQRPTAEQLLEHAFPDAHWATFDFASARAAGLERKRAEIMAHRENQKRARERMMQKRQQQRDRGAPMDVVGLMDLEISSDEYDSDVYTGSEFDSDDLVEDDSDREVEDEGEVDERDKEAEIEITYIGDNRTIVSDIAGSATMIPAIVKLSDRTNSLAIEPVVTVTSARFEQITNSRTTTQSPSSTIPSNNDPTTYGYGKDDTETYGFGKEARRDLEVTVGAGLVASARRGSRSGPTTPSTGSTTPTSITSAGSTPPTGTLAAITAATIVGVGTMFGEARFR